MGVLKSFSRADVPMKAGSLPSGCFSVHREGGLVISTLPSTVSEELILDIARKVISVFQNSQQTSLGVVEVNIRYAGFHVFARDLRGGVLIFLHPQQQQFIRKAPPQVMSYKNLDEFILHLEAHIECWKQFNQSINLARDRRFTPEDEAQFLDLKSLITQGTEAISASEVKGGPRKDEVLALFAAAPSLRFLSDATDSFATVEGQWHRIYLTLQSLLGQLKVQLTRVGEKPVVPTGWSLFKKK